MAPKSEQKFDETHQLTPTMAEIFTYFSAFQVCFKVFPSYSK